MDPSEDYPGYGRGYPAPPPGPYGARVPPPGYAPSSYSGGGSGGYAPPFGAAPGALTHYGAPGAYQYPPANPFSPQPAPPMGGAGYFGAPHHSGHSTPGGYPHDPMGGYPQHPGYGGGYPGYMPPGMPPPHMQYYPPQWPHSEHGSATGDPEVEKKLLAIEELMKNQKLDYERAQKELAARDAKDAADKKAAEAAAEAAKKAAEREADAAKKAAEEKASWEKKLEEEKKAARAQGAENAKKAQEAAEKKAAEKAAEEKLKADAKAAEEALAKAKLDAAAELEKAKKEAAEEAEKIKKENAEALAKALEKPAPVEKKKPIKFKDAVGRKFSFPYHLCETWGGMEELIRQAFLHVEVIGPHVAEGHYDLIGPNGEIILPQVWETMIEPDWSITMHMWPMPEPPKGPPGPPPGPPGHGHPFDRPRSGHRHSRHGPPPPPGPPPVGHRGGPPPPPPANWPGGPPRPGPPPGAGPGPGPGPPPPIIVMGGGSGPPRPSRRKTEPPKGVLGWMAGKPAKPSGKGQTRRQSFFFPVTNNHRSKKS